MPPAARITDMHVCPMFDGPKPHVGGPILPPAAPTVLIGHLPAARVTDQATCVGPPDVIVRGSPTVLINNLMAARVGDQTGHGGIIVTGCPTVLIGEAGMSITFVGTPAEQALLGALVERIRNAGPQGRAFIESLESNPQRTRLQIAAMVSRNDGTVFPLSATGGGVTLRPNESPSGDIEIHVDPNYLITYTATDGSSVQETPAGLLLHELGHAERLNAGDPAQATGGPDAEANVRAVTNPLRQELGMLPEQ